MRASLPNGRYDAVFAANDRMALGAILHLRQAGLRVPEDVAVAGFDDAFFTEYVGPPLTTVRQPFRELGVTAMETLVIEPSIFRATVLEAATASGLP